MDPIEFDAHIGWVLKLLPGMKENHAMILNPKPYSDDQQLMIDRLILQFPEKIVAVIEKHPNPQVNGRNLAKKLTELMNNEANKAMFYFVVSMPKPNYNPNGMMFN